MPNEKVTNLPEKTTILDTDEMYLVDGADKKFTGLTLRQQVGTYYEQTIYETISGVAITDKTYEPGNVFRYGAVADSALGVQGADNTSAFQSAVDSGHSVSVPGGYFSIEGKLAINGEGSVEGGKSFTMTSNTRLERFTDGVDGPMIHVQGSQDNVYGNGGVIAARNNGAYDKGLVLVGTDPDETDPALTEVQAMYYGYCGGFKIIGRTVNTGYNGSIGIYINASGRKRGDWIAPDTHPTYYNSFENIHSTQWDFPIHISTDSNFNSFVGCSFTSYGHAAVSNNGYGNQFEGCRTELPTAQDATERFAWYFGRKDDPYGPETGCDASAATVAITGITNANPAVVTAVGHGEITEALIKIESVTDSGAGTLESVVNEGHFQIIRLTDDTFSIPIDTTGLATYSSGGVVRTDFYPILGARANQVSAATEIQFDASTRKVRLVGFGTPVGAYDVNDITDTYGKNVINVTGTFPGGIGKDGFSDEAAIGNNIVNVTSAVVNRTTPIDYHGFVFRQLDDGTGGISYKGSVAEINGRVIDMVDDYTYDLFHHDNVGITSASVRIELTYGGKDSTNQDHATSKVVWLCPVTASTVREPKVVYRDGEDFGGEIPFIPKISYSAGTRADTGKFVVSIGTNNVVGTLDGFCSWDAKLIATNLNDGTTENLDWPGDISYLSTSSAGAVTDTEWVKLTKIKSADTSRATDDTPSADPHLTGWSVKPDAYYKVTGAVILDTDTTADFQFDFDFSSPFQSIAISAVASDDSGINTTDGTAQFDATGASLDGRAQKQIVNFNGTFKTNATTGGTVDFDWAQGTSDVYSTTLEEHSQITIEKL